MDAAREDDFERFAVRELPGLLRLATMLTGDSELARDLVQNVMLKTHRNWPRVRAADHPRLFVRTMLTREHLSWRRRWAVRHVLLGFDDGLEGEPAADHASSVVDRDEMWRRLSGLPRQQRAVLVLRYYERLTDVEIAEVLQCNPATVRGYAARALTGLRLELATETELQRRTP